MGSRRLDTVAVARLLAGRCDKVVLGRGGKVDHRAGDRARVPRPLLDLVPVVWLLLRPLLVSGLRRALIPHIRLSAIRVLLFEGC